MASLTFGSENDYWIKNIVLKVIFLMQFESHRLNIKIKLIVKSLEGWRANQQIDRLAGWLVIPNIELTDCPVDYPVSRSQYRLGCDSQWTAWSIARFTSRPVGRPTNMHNVHKWAPRNGQEGWPTWPKNSFQIIFEIKLIFKFSEFV